MFIFIMYEQNFNLYHNFCLKFILVYHVFMIGTSSIEEGFLSINENKNSNENIQLK